MTNVTTKRFAVFGKPELRCKRFVLGAAPVVVFPACTIGKTYSSVQKALAAVEAEWEVPDRPVELDNERRAAMVSNLLVVLCSDRHTQPVVNTGSLYT